MNEDRLKNLLKQADSNASPGPNIQADLPKRVAQIAHRRRVVRTTGVTIIAITSLITASLWWSFADQPRDKEQSAVATESTGSDKTSAQLQTRIQHLQAEIQMREQIIEKLLAAEALRKQQKQRRTILAQPTASQKLDQQIERAASTLIYQAEQMLKDPARRSSAAKQYQRVINLYPNSHAAKIAQEKLTKLKI